MKITVFRILCVVITAFGLAAGLMMQSCAEPAKGAPVNEIRIRKFPVAVQCWTFHAFTFTETLDKVQALGLHYIQPFSGQKLGGDFGEAVLGPDLSNTQLEKVREEMRKRDITPVAYGVVNFDDNEASARKVFEFAKKLGIGIVVTEPAWDDWSLLDRMIAEYGIRVAIHNHPFPSKYSHPETALSRMVGHDPSIGVCADTGHWMRSSVKPVDALRAFDGRIVDVHLKDLKDYGSTDTYDVPFGSGAGNVRAILTELTRQNYRGYLTIEHENPAELQNPEPSIRAGLAFLDSIAYYGDDWKQLIAWDGSRFTKQGWNHYGPGYFTLDEKTGELTSHGGMGLMWFAAEQYGDFELELEYRCAAPETNSGVFVRVPEMPSSDAYIYHSFEIQIADKEEGIHATGAVYDAEPVTARPYRPAGEWNHCRIVFRGNRITVAVNGQQVVDWNAEPRGKVRDFAPAGFIGLQNHDDIAPVSFRNIYVRSL